MLVCTRSRSEVDIIGTGEKEKSTKLKKLLKIESKSASLGGGDSLHFLDIALWKSSLLLSGLLHG
jgi:hypothetical protein